MVMPMMSLNGSASLTPVDIAKLWVTSTARAREDTDQVEIVVSVLREIRQVHDLALCVIIARFA